METLKRLRAFSARLVWVARLNRNPIVAFFLLLRLRKHRGATHTIRVNGRDVCFRASDEQALREIFVDDEYKFLRDYLREIGHPKILDVGAHIGAFAVWCLNVAPGAEILSVEADPDTFEVLRRNTELFRSTSARWTVRQAAAGARDGEVLMLSNSGPSMSHRISSAGSVSVSSVSLSTLIDQLAPECGVVDLLKVDIEGSEQAFLCGGLDVLKRVKALVAELHPSLCDAQHVEAALREQFDNVLSIQGRMSTKPLLFCRRTEGRHE